MPQSDKKNLYPFIANEYNLPLDLVQSIGDTVFKAWAAWQKKPSSLILNIKGFGRQYMRYKKTLTKKDVMFRKNYDYEVEENNIFEDEMERETYLWQREWMENLRQRLDTYENEYLPELREIKKKRNELKKFMDAVKIQAERQAAKTPDFKF